MSLKHLLVHVDSGPRSAERVALAAALARRFGARITGLFAESGRLGASLVARRSPQNLAKAAADAHVAFDAGAAGLDAEWWEVPTGEYDEVVGWTVVACRYADLCVFGQHDPDEEERVPGDLIERTIFESGRPVLVVPSVGTYADVGRRVVVAWTGSRESARALADALPLLEKADEVRVLSFQAPSEGRPGAPRPRMNVLAHLAAHGVKAKYETVIVDDLGVLDPLLNRASDAGADLTVIGAYPPGGFSPLGRSRTTRDILRTMTTPVLLSS